MRGLVVAAALSTSPACIDRSGDRDSSSCVDPDREPGKECTLIGWTEGLAIEVNGESGESFPDGIYRFDIVADGVASTSEIVSADPPSCVGPGDESGTYCELFLLPGDGRELTVRVSRNRSSIGGAPSIVKFSLHLYYRMEECLADWDGGPATVDVVVSQDAEQLGSDHFEPVYDVFEPNGPGCGVATSAADTMVLAVP